MENHSIFPQKESFGGIAPRRVTVTYGFWLFIISDIILFASLFAAYGVLRNATDGGPTEKEIFDLRHVGIETAILLASSFTCGMTSVAVYAKSKSLAQVFLTATVLLGLSFIFLEVQEFRELINEGAGPQRSAFLSAFFALVGCHGIHVCFGIVWAILIQLLIWKKGFRPDVERRLMCFTLFWHALDVVWIGVFTVVYLIGVL
ncbi:cytochrome o ubiquinol oxidase subunit III [Akkermansiaceae bacterium]|nr:cytochrome o ubiquinol oxidase subunit III [Akkermansiaceae bacterium]